MNQEIIEKDKLTEKRMFEFLIVYMFDQGQDRRYVHGNCTVTRNDDIINYDHIREIKKSIAKVNDIDADKICIQNIIPLPIKGILNNG